MDSNREREHLLALKVMRLTKPTFVSNPFVLQCDPERDLPLDTFSSITNSDTAQISTALSQVLTLPQNFGNIFLGETFSSYISIHNDSKQTCREVSVKADLQTSSQRITLTATAPPTSTPTATPPTSTLTSATPPASQTASALPTSTLTATAPPTSSLTAAPPTTTLTAAPPTSTLTTAPPTSTLNVGTPTSTQLLPDSSIDEIIHHEVKELGTHILVCAVSYLNAAGEKQYFRKFFKFHVLKPLDVKTKFYHTESDDVYLEAQIQNITPGPLYLERVPLEPSPLYTVSEFQTDPLTLPSHSNKRNVVAGAGRLVEKGGEGVERDGGARYLGPLDIHQYLYCLSPRPEAGADVRLLKGVTSIGKLDIVWKTNMGEKGRLQTSPLQRVAPGSGDVKVSVECVPQAVPVSQVFPVRLRITNCCEQRTMDLQLLVTNTHTTGLIWTGLCGRAIGKVESCGQTSIDLHLVAIRTGLLTVSGLRLTDLFLRRTYELDELAQVFVYETLDSSAH